MRPRRTPLKNIKDTITQLTARAMRMISMDWVVNEVNATVHGWVGHFPLSNCNKAFGRVGENRMQGQQPALPSTRVSRNRK